MARLPTPGGDDGTWGSILNDFLSVAHNDDGTVILDTDGTLAANSDTKIASQKAVKTYVDGTVSAGAPDADGSTKGIIQLAGDLSGTAASPQIATGVIVNTDINASAAIAQSKIANLTSDLAGKQASDADLTAIAGLSPSDDDVLQRKSGNWTNRTPSQLKTDLSLTKSDVGLGNVDNTSDATKNSASVTLTNKTIDADNNTLSNVEVDNFKASAIVTEGEGIDSNDNDTTLPTSAAVKDYVDSNALPTDAPLGSSLLRFTGTAGSSNASRKLFWFDDLAATLDSEIRSTFAEASTQHYSFSDQPGHAHRITNSGSLKAVIVTKNVFATNQYVNIHLVDSSAPFAGEPFSLLAAVDLTGYLAAWPQLPWHLKSRVVGDEIEFVLWADGDIEPDYGASGQSGSATVPSPYDVAVGKNGLFVGHMPAGSWLEFNDIYVNDTAISLYELPNLQTEFINQDGSDDIVPSITTNRSFNRDSAQTFLNKRIVPRVTTITSSATPTIDTDTCDAVTITAQAAAITSMTTNLFGTPNNFDKLMIRIKDNGTARAITWGSAFEAKGVALPTTTVISKVLTVLFIYDSVTSKWGCVASAQEA